jgi:hypothetical protein
MKHSDLRKKFKIHGIDSVTGASRSANNNKFYDSYDEAETAARKCVAQDRCSGIVIFQAIALIEAASPPICVTNLEECE